MITYRALGRNGRLGNQLFQIAATIGIGIDHHEWVVFPTDWIYRPYFSIPDEYFGDVHEKMVEATEFAQHLDYRARPYLQDINLFWKHMAVIREHLRPSPLAQDTLNEIVFPGGRVLGVHVRRGDNVFDPGVPNKSDYHLCPSLDYYQRGVSEVAFNEPFSTACFSDDIPWCRENIPADFYGDGTAYPKENEPTYGVERPRDWIDLFVLAACDRLVISGSTFGIWGALLANTPHVVRPDRVYGPVVAAYTDSELLFPPEWRTCRVT